MEGVGARAVLFVGFEVAQVAVAVGVEDLAVALEFVLCEGTCVTLDCVVC